MSKDPIIANKLSIGIVIPAYNPEIQTLESFIKRIRDVIDPEIIRIEIDMPNQSHVDILEDMAEVNSVNSRRGKGRAIMEGFDALDTDILAFADADGSVPARSLDTVTAQLAEGSADVSIGSRRHPSSHIITHQSPTRRFLGDVFAFAARRMLPTQCRDYQCGAKALRDDAWEAIGQHCYETGFAWDLEFVTIAGSLGYDINEVPVDWEDDPNSAVNTIPTIIELATALIIVKRRADAIATSP